MSVRKRGTLRLGRLFALSVALGLLAVIPGLARTVLVESGDAWRYLDDGSDQGTAWRATGFDDSSWAAGPAQLGYGEADEATVVSYGPVSSNKYITTYFRHNLVLPNPSGIDFLEMGLLRDDGAIVYINGTEVWRTHLPAGAVSYLTPANAFVEYNEEEAFFYSTIPAAGLLAMGTNTVAVEIHQYSGTGSDLSFDFRCTAITDVEQVLVSRGATWRFDDLGPGISPSWNQPWFNDTGWEQGAAELGYGDGDEVTEVGYGTNSLNKYITTYFRHAFNVPSTNDLNYLNLSLVRDDGAVVYLNGQEVLRSNLPDGPVADGTFASSFAEGPEERLAHETLVPADGLLWQGTNVLAVEIHQSSVASSDISFDFACEALVEVPPADLVRGPYLQMGSHTGAVVCWRTDIPTDSWVCYGPSPDDLSTTVIEDNFSTEHAVEITGLDPNTTYYYDVGNTEFIFAGGDSNHFWITHPVPGQMVPVRMWVLGDSGTAGQDARNVRDAFAAWTGPRDADLWLMLGDNAYYDGSDAEYQEAVFDAYPDMLRRRFLWSTFGNHDGYTASSPTQAGPYYSIFHLPKGAESGGVPSGTEAYYAFDYANIHFVCLNSYDMDRSTNGAMYAWAEADLASTLQDWIIAFWHHPPYSKGSHDSDAEYRLYEMRETFLPLLDSYGTDLVLSGHSHSYERSVLLHGHYGLSSTLTASMIIDGGDGREGSDGVYDKTATNGAVYAVAGSSGQIGGGTFDHPVMLLSSNLLGSMVIDVDGDRLDAWFVGDTPVTWDHFSIVKSVTNHPLIVQADGPGTIMPNGGVYRAGTAVQVTATPEIFYAFGGWSGDLGGTVNPDTVVMNTGKTVIASFEALRVTNGVPQWWLAAQGLDTNDVAALSDLDLDGATAWEEYIADTLPGVSSSVFRVERIDRNAGTEVQFSGSTQRVYQLEYTADAGVTGWSGVPGQSNLPGTGPGTVLLDAASEPTRSYRVNVRLPE